ncbi:MAG TPA: glycosyltransferase family 2 protein, partial [Candidatus Wallbacteria bacterium]|nr:glycosyltransferase family 2 protein [Candidatus Wallbacteria bacterium]
ILTFVLYYAGILNVDTFMLFLWLSIVLGIEITLLSLLIEEFTIKKYERKIDVARLFFYSIIENFGYRQLNLFFRLKGLFSFAARNNRWGEMVRKPFTRV